MNEKRGEKFLTAPGDPLGKMRYVGGKAINLYYMSAIGIKVPKWICLSTEGFDFYLDSILDEIALEFNSISADEVAEYSSAANKISSLIHSIQVGPELLSEIRQALGGEKLLAVRSSATGEDGASFSFAGQLESFLFVSMDDLESKIKSCWASGYSSRILQ